MLNLAERLNHSGVDLALFFGAAENWRRFVALGIAELSALVPLIGANLHLKDLALYKYNGAIGAGSTWRYGWAVFFGARSSGGAALIRLFCLKFYIYSSVSGQSSLPKISLDFLASGV